MALHLILFAFAILGDLIESSPSPHPELKTFTLEELVPLQINFFPKRLFVQWVSDTEYILAQPTGVKKYDVTNDTSVTLLSQEELFNIYPYSVSTFSHDQKYVLLTTNKKKVYRYSTSAEYAVYNLETKSITRVGQGPLQVVIWDRGHQLAYVQDNNVYYVPDAAHPDIVRPLTTAGVPGEMYYGAPDWIYEEEVLNSAEAMWFSPSGTYLAVASFNDTNVESAVYPFYGNASDPENVYPEMVHFKYPKAGRTNPVVGLRVFKLDDETSEPWNIPAPVDLIGLDHILGRVNWASDQNLFVLWLNRRQSISVLFNCDLHKDKCGILNEHKESNGWIDIREPIFGANGTKFVMIKPLHYEDQRFMHAARIDVDSFAIDDLSPGNSTVTDIVGWNEATDSVYYVVAPGTEPWLRQLWVTSKGKARCISCQKPSCHNANGVFSTEASYAIVACSSTNSPPKSYLYDTQQDTFKLITDNAALYERLSQYKLPMALFNVITLEEDNRANIQLLLPPDMETGKKYPMIVKVYGGPSTSRVKDCYDLEYDAWYLTANRSIIVASIDVRGSGVMGVEAMHALNMALGTVEITDTLEAIKRLTEMYPFIDETRVGVWGWSYGGFTSTMMLAKDDAHTLACGAAVAPVTSWLYYDTIYTERYMDTPQVNPEGYKRSDLMALVEYLRDKKYLLVHGTGDDNVHFQHSLQLAKEMQHADIPFEQMSYTDETHSLRGVSRHFYHMLDHFWTECFNL
ncbi:venom dipeptidyl peptidase 4 isoform X2 [Epargyreus clarus]|uniref:venom dipeptidyl peptidase 4 isoform X2 n=1 Tax=Epargyreus clarus TaxID=520877 RepID=UPI003C2DAF75